MSNPTNGATPKATTGTLSFGSLLESVRAKCNPVATGDIGEDDDLGLEYVDEEAAAGQTASLATVGGGENMEYEDMDSQETDIMPADDEGPLDIGMDVDLQVGDLAVSLETGAAAGAAGRPLTRSRTSKGPEELEQKTKKKSSPAKAAASKGSTKTPGAQGVQKTVKGTKTAGAGAKAAVGQGAETLTPAPQVEPAVAATATLAAGDVANEEAPPAKKERKPAGRPPKAPHACPTQALLDEVAKLTEASKAHDTYTRALAKSLTKERQRVGEQQLRIDAQQRKIEEQQRMIEGHLKKAEGQQGRAAEVLRRIAEQEVKTEGLRRRMKAAESQITAAATNLDSIGPILTNVDDFIGTTQAQLEDVEGDLARALALGVQVNDIDERLQELEQSDTIGYDGLGKRQRGVASSGATGTAPHSGFGFQASRQAATPATQRPATQRPAPPASPWPQRPAIVPAVPVPTASRPRTAIIRVGPLDARGKPFDVLKSYVLAIPNGERMMSSVGRVRVDPQSSEHITATINPPEQADLFMAAWNSFDFPRSAMRPFATLSYQGN